MNSVTLLAVLVSKLPWNWNFRDIKAIKTWW